MTGKTNLYLLQESVKDEASFLEFVGALLHDWLDECQKEKENPSSTIGSAGANGWQNGDLASFLEAGIAWATAHPKFKDEEINPWQRFATFLHAGKFYE